MKTWGLLSKPVHLLPLRSQFVRGIIQLCIPLRIKRSLPSGEFRYFCTTAFSIMFTPSREASLPFTVIVFAA